jgi:hypothetical protein
MRFKVIGRHGDDFVMMLVVELCSNPAMAYTYCSVSVLLGRDVAKPVNVLPMRHVGDNMAVNVNRLMSSPANAQIPSASREPLNLTAAESPRVPFRLTYNGPRIRCSLIIVRDFLRAARRRLI